jgi:hypothetical protein
MPPDKDKAPEMAPMTAIVSWQSATVGLLRTIGFIEEETEEFLTLRRSYHLHFIDKATGKCKIVGDLLRIKKKYIKARRNIYFGRMQTSATNQKAKVALSVLNDLLRDERG